MKWLKSAMLLLVLFGAFASGAASAHGGHSRAHVGVFFSAPLSWPYYAQPYYSSPYYPSPYYASPYYASPYYPYYPSPFSYPPVVVVPSSPPEYIEREQSSAPQYWYFCSDPQGYYPYVQQCPAGWQQVTPRPAGN